MKIALYHPWIYLKSGLERTLLEIAKRSEHDWIFYTSHYDKTGTFPELENYDIREINRVTVEREYGAVMSAAKSIASIKLDDSEFDALVISCDGLGSFLTLRNHSKPILNLCFTPLRAVYDEEYRLRHLEKHKDKKIRALLMEKIYKIVDRYLWRYYDHVVCISQTVKERIEASHLFPSCGMSVHYPGIDENHIKVSPSSKPYFFLPGRIMWTKNLELGVEAFLQFEQLNSQGFELVIAGMVDKKSQAYFENLKSLASGSQNVRFELNPSDEKMQQLYAEAYCTLFTAFNEDLGLTPMESMTKGKPVIAVNKGGPREVVQHMKTGLLLPADVNSFAAGMQLLAADPDLAKSMGKYAATYVEKFSWKHFVKGLDHQIDLLVKPELDQVAVKQG